MVYYESNPINGSLRHCSTFAKKNKIQMLIMLIGI